MPHDLLRSLHNAENVCHLRAVSDLDLQVQRHEEHIRFQLAVVSIGTYFGVALLLL